MNLEGDAAIKRDIRRRRNREAARKLKQRRALLEQQLEKEINHLELEERSLRLQVHLLHNYRYHLEHEHRQRLVMRECIRQQSSTSVGQYVDKQRTIDHHRQDTQRMYSSTNETHAPFSDVH
jgi:hypothetical protein